MAGIHTLKSYFLNKSLATFPNPLIKEDLSGASFALLSFPKIISIFLPSSIDPFSLKLSVS